VAGGVGRDGESLDDLYCLDAENKAWSRLYLAESSNKLGNGARQVRLLRQAAAALTLTAPPPLSPTPTPTPTPHQVCFCGKSLYLVAVGSPGQLDAVSTMEIATLAASASQFARAMEP